jgi:dihydroneopterin aldolase
MGKIELEGMHFYAYHGHFDVERVTGNKFLVNLSIVTNLEKAAKSDDLNDTINYQKVYDIVKKEMQQKSHLLENVAKRIIDVLYSEFTEIDKIKVKISKLNPPMGGKIEKASVTLSR